MPRWFIQGFIHEANETELLVYQALKHLDDSWSVRWTYHYQQNGQPREGDFLILGPDGNLLVLEVKKRGRLYAQRGTADGKAVGGDDEQVQAQKAGVLRALLGEEKRFPQNYQCPRVSPALFTSVGTGWTAPSNSFPIGEIRGVATLRRLPDFWNEMVDTWRREPDLDQVRDLFHAVYGDSSVEAEAKFLQSTDRLILDRITADMQLLEGLQKNQQILVCGGAGTGKTWMAERLAEEWAKEGKKVLMLCYNKALGNDLAEDFLKTPGLPGGSITVHTWESLADWLVGKLPKPQQGQIKPPDQRDNTYYEVTLPELMLDAVTSAKVKPRFDALVVDEAQDHNTAWWPLYLLLLQQGGKSRIGLFYDPAQRPSFRAKSGSFDVDEVASFFSQPAHFTLGTTRRYTREIFDYLVGLKSTQTQSLVDGLHDASNLLAGPEVVEIAEIASIEDGRVRAADVLSGWIKKGLLEPSEVLLLTRHDPFSSRRRWFTHGEAFAGGKIVPAHDKGSRDPGKLRVTSFHKSKGLDAKAVVMLDTLPWDALRPGDREGYWIAASRARQLLAVLTMRR